MTTDIKDLSLRELKARILEWGYPEFCAGQIFSWIYKKNSADFKQMSSLGLDLRRKLQSNFYIRGIEPVKELDSIDGTRKFLFRLQDGQMIETVAIPAQKRITGCISTQAGCKFACKFCASGLLGFKRNLACGEIIEQALFLKDNSQSSLLTHLVFMGIGEPLDNYDNLLKAIRIINADYSLNIGARRMTVSTCGIVPGIKRLSEEGLQIELSISLHAADDKTRSEIMPVNKVYPLSQLLPACADYIRKTGRQITFEYILIKDVNSDLQNAQKLCRILNKLKLCKVNLIPANVIKEYNIMPPDKKEVMLFRDFLDKQRINVTLRRKRGDDIEAACGQLRIRYEKY